MAHSSVLRDINWITKSSSSHASIESGLLAAAIQVLRRVDRFQTWNPAEITQRLRSRFPAAPSAKVQAEMLRDIYRILTLQKDLKPSDDQVEGGGVANAILQVLRDPSPESLEKIEQKSSNEPETEFVTALLLGSLNGFEVLPFSKNTIL